MYPELFHCWGPFSIQSYGVMIVLGILVFSWAFLSDSRTHSLITAKQYFDTLSVAIIAALVGGRFFNILLQSAHGADIGPWWAPWTGGFSILGAFIAIIIAVFVYLYYLKLPMLRILDVAATYGALLQAIARIGCFLAGCCYGLPTTAWFGIRILEGASHLHPTQLYSAAALVSIFCIMYFLIRPLRLSSGMPLCIYGALMSLERFSIDFFRGDREFFEGALLFSSSQWIALSLFAISVILLIILSWYHQRHRAA